MRESGLSIEISFVTITTSVVLEIHKNEVKFKSFYLMGNILQTTAFRVFYSSIL